MDNVNGQPMLLEGCKVLDLTQYLAGAGVTRLMAELGADIIKFEIAPVGDPGRLLPVVKNERSGFFIQHNRGKKSLCLDWEKPEALEILRDLAKNVDIVTENFGRADILERRGLDYESIKEFNPGVIYLSLSVFGRKSPWAHRPGYDYIAQAASGIMHMTGEPDRPPAMVGVPKFDANRLPNPNWNAWLSVSCTRPIGRRAFTPRRSRRRRATGELKTSHATQSE